MGNKTTGNPKLTLGELPIGMVIKDYTSRPNYGDTGLHTNGGYSDKIEKYQIVNKTNDIVTLIGESNLITAYDYTKRGRPIRTRPYEITGTLPSMNGIRIYVQRAYQRDLSTLFAASNKRAVSITGAANGLSIPDMYEARSMVIGIDVENTPDLAWKGYAEWQWELLNKYLIGVLRESAEHARLSIDNPDYVPPTYYVKGNLDWWQLVDEVVEGDLFSASLPMDPGEYWVDATSVGTISKRDTANVEQGVTTVFNSTGAHLNHITLSNGVILKAGLLPDTEVYMTEDGEYCLFAPYKRLSLAGPVNY